MGVKCALFVIPFFLLAQIDSPVAPSPSDSTPPYSLEILRVHSALRDRDGVAERYVTVEFNVKRNADGQPATDVSKNELRIEEDGAPVSDLEIYEPSAEDPLTAFLTLDVSGSMNDHGKMIQARQAAGTFLDQLHDQVDCGLILFNHELLLPLIPPVRDPKRNLENRQKIRKRIETVAASGGTAYWDAAAEAINNLQGIAGRKAVLLMTDGVDTNSRATMADVVALAQNARTPVYTLGVGEPGKKEPVTTVLVLDCSGSMDDRADERDPVTKIAALRESAARYVDLMRTDSRTTLVPFNERATVLSEFTGNKDLLKQSVRRLQAGGETALFDAILGALGILEEQKVTGKKAVVALTDGVDNRSQFRVADVIERAQAMKVPLYLLGLGRTDVHPPEIDEPVMKQMATRTGGQYYHARNRQSLYEIFENLAIQLHDDGIDEEALRQLADQTGGRYTAVRDASELKLIYRGLAEELQSTYTATFTSRRASHDGTARGIDISIWRGGRPQSAVAMTQYNVHGVVVPEMSRGVYLAFLVVLSALLLAPAGIRRLYRFYGGS